MARLTKTLQGLIERAERNGTAIKRVREGQVMGNYGGWKGDLINQWKVEIDERDEYKLMYVEHYDTTIAVIRHNVNGTVDLVRYYGESNSDRDALNGLCEYYYIDRSFRYKPSTCEFSEVTVDIGKVQSEMARGMQEHLRKEAPWILGGVS